MDALVKIAIKGGTAITHFATKKLREWVGYVIDYKENLKNVKLLHDKLINKQKDVEKLVEEGIRKGEKVANQVEDWQEWAEEVATTNIDDNDWSVLLFEEETRKAAERCCFNLVGWNPKFRHDLSLKAEEKINLIKDRLNELDGLPKLTLPRAPPSLGSAGQGDFCQHLKSRQDEVKMIMEALKIVEVNRIGIHGMGGAGKTTLVNEVARCAIKEKLFKHVVVVEISRVPNVRYIQDRIAERIGFSFQEVYTVEERGYRLYERFKEIRKGKQGQSKADVQLLFILDNLWEKQALPCFGIDYDLEADVGCKIIVTSRTEEVCKKMGASYPHIHKVGDLNPDEAEILFREKVKDTLKQSPEYEHIMKEILVRCSRLPLSINILADTLKNKDVNFWKSMLQNFERNKHGELQGVLSKTYSILELSYDNIENEEKKRLFLLCCLFPPGYHIYIQDLLRYGIGLGLFHHVNSLKEAMDQTCSWVDELKSSSLLLDVDIDELEVVKIHDDVREAGKFIASKGEKHTFHVGTIPRWVNEETLEKYGAITVVADQNHEYLSLLNLPNLLLLHLHGASNLCDNYFARMDKIEVLDLGKSCIRTFPCSIDQLRSLRTLLLEGCTLEDISRICRLTKLQVLSFKGSNLNKLSKEIGKLVNLKILDLSDCWNLRDMSAGILVNLTLLEGLYMNNSFNEWEAVEGGNMASISELNNCLSLCVLEIDIRYIEQLDFPYNLVPRLSRFKINLGYHILKEIDIFRTGFVQGRSLAPFGFSSRILYSNRDIAVKNVPDAGDLMKDSWKALLKKVERMIIVNVNGWWIGEQLHKSVPEYFSNDLQELYLYCVEGIEYALPGVDSSKSLKVVEVANCGAIRYVLYAPTTNITTSDIMIELPSLQKLILSDLPSLCGFCDVINGHGEEISLIPTLFTGEVKFGRLEELCVDSLGEFEMLWDMLSGEEFSCLFPKLRCLFIRNMPMLKNVWSEQFIWGEERFTLSNLEDLKIYACNSLESVCPLSVVINGLLHLTSLSIESCCAMKQVISADSDHHHHIHIDRERSVCFPALSSLLLKDLESLVCFYTGSISLECSTLKHLVLDKLDNLEAFVKPAGRGFKYAPDDEDLFQKEAYPDNEDDNLRNDEKACPMGVGTLLMFPSLEELFLTDIAKIERVWWDTTAKDEAASSKVFPTLQIIYIGGMPKLKHVWSNGKQGCSFPDLKMVSIYDCECLESVFPPIVCTGLERLEVLNISWCNNLKLVVEEAAVSDEKNINNSVCFLMLLTITLQTVPSLSCFYQGSLKIEFPSLQTLLLAGVNNLKTFAKPGGYIWSTDGPDDNDLYYNSSRRASTSLFSGEKVSMPSLEELHIDYPAGSQNNIEIIWDAAGVSEEFKKKLPKITTIFINEMPNIRGVWKGDANIDGVAGRLRNITIVKCRLMRSLFLLSSSSSPPYYHVPLDDEYQFQAAVAASIKCEALENLYLHSLPMIEMLAHNKTKSSVPISDVVALFTGKLENLQKMVVKSCPEMGEMFAVKLPRLEYLEVFGLSKMNHIQCHMVPNLQILIISCCLLGGSSFLIPSSSGHHIKPRLGVFEKLKELNIEKSGFLEAIVAEPEEERQGILGKDSGCTSGNSNIIEFPLLNTVVLKELPELSCFTSVNSCSEVRLPSLRVLRIYNCTSIERFTAATLVAPMLTSFRLERTRIRMRVNEDLNVILDKNKMVKRWSTNLTHKLHQVHKLRLYYGQFGCCGCDQLYQWMYVFACLRCDFVLCVDCALDESRLMEIPNELKVSNNWPTTLESPHHSGTEYPDLRLLPTNGNGESYTCEACKQEGSGWVYMCCYCYCGPAGFRLHPKCVLQESLLLNDLDEDLHKKCWASCNGGTSYEELDPLMPKEWPRNIRHPLHVVQHTLKLRRGRSEYRCNVCGKVELELFSYTCDGCGFSAHPNCVLEANVQISDKNEGTTEFVSEEEENVLEPQISDKNEGTTVARSTHNFSPVQVSESTQLKLASSSSTTVLSSSPSAPSVPLLIGSKFVESKSSEFIHVINPATHEVVSKVPLITYQEFNDAVSAANQAFPTWKNTPVITRLHIMRKLRELICRDIDKLALKITTEQGKTLKDAKAEIFDGIEVVHLACGMTTLQMELLASSDIQSYYIREPLGVCAAICPSNFSAFLPLWVFPIAIACGNTFILKPSDKDSGVVTMLALLALEAGLPAGVLNIIYGSTEIIDTICEDDYIRAISFVGSHITSLDIYAKGSIKAKRTQCNVRAKNYAIVMPDADVDATLDSVVKGGFGADGERVVPLTHLIFVGESSKWELELCKRVSGLKVNAGAEPDAEIGPLESTQEKERICTLIQSAVESGARLLHDGRKVEVTKYEHGDFIGPTILSDIKPCMECYEADICGPILLCIQTNSMEEAITVINKNSYVNGAFVFTSSITARRKFRAEVDARQVGVNVLVSPCVPFISSMGKKAPSVGGLDSYGKSELEFYTQVKTVT